MKIIILGPPGSGKGTIAEKLAKDFNLIPISAGEILRKEIAKHTSLGKKVKSIGKGVLAPNKLVSDIIRKNIKNKNNFILDGFPRTISQAKETGIMGINEVIYLNVAEKPIIKRLSGRRVCPKGHTYHLTNFPPKKSGICDIDGSKLEKREDDKPEVIKKRFKIFHKEIKPVLAYFKDKKLLKTANADQNPRNAYLDVKKLVKNIYK